MDGPPSGTVTLLFTDIEGSTGIEGSTRLWEAEPAAMTTALRRHDKILRSAIEGSAGRAAAARVGELADGPADPGAGGAAHGRVRGTRQRLLRPGRQPDGPAGGHRARRAGGAVGHHRGPAVRLAAQAALVILDNCEHVIDEAAAFCSRVVRACPRGPRARRKPSSRRSTWSS
jgi:hypothetical protein